MNQTANKAGSKVPLKNKNQNELTNEYTFGKLDQIHKKTDHEQSKKSGTNPLRLLIGKVVFLDINNSYKILNKVKECMKLVDAKIADCLSKDVNYVITNRGNNYETFRSTEVPDNAKKTKTSPNTINYLSRSSSLINRTQAILEKASKGNPSTDILSTARRLGINVMNVSDLEKYIEKFSNKKRNLELGDKVSFSKNSCDETLDNKNTGLLKSLTQTENHKIYKLKNNYIKFESICKQYKPIYQEFECWHEINFEILQNKSTYSPFQLYFSDDNGSSNCSSKRNEQKSRQSEDFQIDKSPINKFKSPKSSILRKVSSKANLTSKETVFKSNTAYSFLANVRVQSNTEKNYLPRKKSTGYCECCKQRYENLKKHLNSAQHDTFERNQSNFKEIDLFITGILNFNQFLIKNDLLVEEENDEKNSNDMDEMKQFVKNFWENKSRFGITDCEITEAFNVEFKDPIVTQKTISKFQKLDITPKSSAKVKPVLEILINNSKLKFGDRLKSFPDMDSNKKRKRDCTLSPNALNILINKFNKNPTPTDTEISKLASQINYDEDMIKTWFNEKQQTSKQNYSVKKFKKTNLVDALSLFENSSCSDQTVSSIDDNDNNDDKKNICKLNKVTPKKNLDTENQLKITPPFISSFSISSPSAAALFGLQNSFSHPTDTVTNESLNTPIHNSSITSQLLASKVDFMSGTTEVQTIKSINDEKSIIGLSNNVVKSENSTDLSCIDDVVLAAFVNDFSYEIVHK